MNIIEKTLENNLAEAKKLVTLQDSDKNKSLLKKLILEKHQNFKSLMASNISKINPNYINTNNTLSGLMYITGYHLSSLNKDTKITIKEIFNGSKVVKNNIKGYFNHINDCYYIIGQKYEVLKHKVNLDKKISKLGINLNTLLNSKISFSFQDIKEELDLTLNLKLKEHNIENEKINLLQENSDFSNYSLNNDIIQSIVWKKMKKEIQDSISLLVISEKLFKKDPYFKKLEDFAESNSVSISSIIYLLQYSPKNFEHFKKFNDLEPDIPLIINTYNKYSEYANAALYISKFYINTMIQVSQKYLQNEDFNNLINEKFLSIQGIEFNLKELSEKFNVNITENVTTIKKNKI